VQRALEGSAPERAAGTDETLEWCTIAPDEWEDMTDNSEQETKRPLTLPPRPGTGGRLELKAKPHDAGGGQVRQTFTHGRSKTVEVQVVKRRVVEPTTPARPTPTQAAPSAGPATPAPAHIPVVRQASATPHAPAAAQAVRSVAPPQQAAVARTPVPAPQPPIVRPLAPEPPVQEPEPVAARAAEPVAPPAVEEVEAPAAASTPVEPAAMAPLPVIAEAVPATPPASRPVQVTPARQGPVQVAPPPSPRPAQTARPDSGRGGPPRQGQRPAGGQPGARRPGGGPAPRTLTDEERASRTEALRNMMRADEQAKRQAELDAQRRVREELDRQRQEDEARRKADVEARQRTAEEARRKTEEEEKRKVEEAARKAQKTEEDSRREVAVRAGKNAAAKVEALTSAGKLKPATATTAEPEPEEGPKRGGVGRGPGAARKPVLAPAAKTPRDRRGGGKLTVTKVLNADEGERMRSLASTMRQRERDRRRLQQPTEQVKIIRDVVIPETITVQELAQRMAERGTDVIKALMRAGVMATINQVIDADTAEVIVGEFGHHVKRVAEADVEIGLKGAEDQDEHREARPPVVTIMGHVDHGKTSLLDALRHTDVVSGEAGGITQHIGAYQVSLANGRKITFIDTPGHQAFTAMRARGANVTDIVVLVVAADDGLMDQTIEAIRHAKAANAPMIIAINKMDKPGANPTKVREELLQHEVVVEAMGGEVLDVEVSALKKTGLDKLEEAILLQAELLDLRANPNRSAEGVIIEAKLERGRGPVATVLVQHGTLNVGDIFVAGGEWGRVRALVDDRGNQVKSAGPGTPVEVLGLNGAPLAGDDFSVVESDSRAREITEFRQRKKREVANAAGARGTLEEMFAQIASGATKELPIVVKSDVQGSLEAILASLRGLGNNEVAVRILHGGVGGISESDVNLAHASNAAVIGFNVRANPQARDLARRDGVEIRYYSIIYDVIDDIRTVLEGMLAPSLRETFLGNAQIREVYDITKTGKVAGCYVTEGQVKRGSKVRLLRNDIVIHEGTLKTLRRFKDDVREVKEGYECGMAFENYSDIQVGDIIECFDIEEVARSLQPA
jgi:translation initiation factor IF-2